MSKRCSICRHPRRREILVDYFDAWSYHLTAARFSVGYTSLHRHINNCVAYILEKMDIDEFQERSEFVSEFLMDYHKIESKADIGHKLAKGNAPGVSLS